MDDDFMEYRRSKPQQRLYKPGSGPLRKSSNGLDHKMNAYDIDDGPRGRDHNHYGSKTSIYEDELTGSNKEQSMTFQRNKKPEQQHYIPRTGDCKPDEDRHSKASLRCDNSSQSYNRRKNEKHGSNNITGSYSRGSGRRDHKDAASNDVNYNRNMRQASEPRSSSPFVNARNRDTNPTDRNRDSRSMESSAGRHGTGSGGKPPSGRRNSAGYTSDSPRPKYTFNVDNLPPRLRKKFLEQSGHHSFDNSDHVNRENRDKYSLNNSVQTNYSQGPGYHNTTSWSQTLPSRGRGRLRENENFDREKFINSYLKSYDGSRRSTPSNSYMNLYESSLIENQHPSYDTYGVDSNVSAAEKVTNNGDSNVCDKTSHNDQRTNEDHSKPESDSEAISYNSISLADMANLDWTEEVEKEACDSTTSSPSFHMKTSSISMETKPVEPKPNETREPKRRSRRRDKRSSSRGQHNEKKPERNRRDSGHQDPLPLPLHRERERRDSHRSNRSSNIGNSRDDLDRWRSLRSFSREHSTEGRIVSQCNSRDVSSNRALSPRDNEGFRVPTAAPKHANWNQANNQSIQKKNNGSWSHGRPSSIERGRQSPAPSNAAETAAESTGGGGRRSKRRSGRRRGGRNAEHAATAPPAPAPTHQAHSNTNWREEILESKKHTLQDRLDRHQDVGRNRLNSYQSDKSESSGQHPGLLVLPQGSLPQTQKDRGRERSADIQKTLFDHHNPSKPIIVQTNPAKVEMRMDCGAPDSWARMCGAAWGPGEGGGGGEGGAEAEAEAGEAAGARALRHRPLLQEVDRADAVLHAHAARPPAALAAHWPDLHDTRKFLQNALQRLLLSDLKYCQAENIEHHFWKILYYNFIEKLRKTITQSTPEDKQRIVRLINTIIEEGNTYFENLVQLLEKTYKFNTKDYINGDHMLPPKGLGFVGLALISVQKLYLFLGDLARYKEQVNETNNFAKSKFWYTKAQQINPKNGRPYNQLAILAIYARRKLDAVYYYMRSLMSSNPFHSARESLISLFDENRKKYEAAERKRRIAQECSEGGTSESTTRGREVWIKPSAASPSRAPPAALSPVELNKNFITSYLHVHGKLVTKIGMESFHQSASLMLRQFVSLLHVEPLPTTSARLLQLTQLNMFCVESAAHAESGGGGGGGGRGCAEGEGRSAALEGALGVALLMFGAMLERCCALLPHPPASQHHADAALLLPAIKVWSDWMLCHSSKWNPPPSFHKFDVGSDIDPWDWLAKLMNILETLDDKSVVFESEMKEGSEAVRLPEDVALAGFTPLMYLEASAAFIPRDAEGAAAGAGAGPHHAEHLLRTRKLLFFGTEYLVGVEPPVLRLECPPGAPPRYVSAVLRSHANTHALTHLSEDSEEEVEGSSVSEREVPWAAGRPAGEGGAVGDAATRRLLRRKEQLEAKRADMERRRHRMQELLAAGGVSLRTEVRPRWLVPDTNCFIEHLPLLRRLAAPPAACTLAVPLVVIIELEGLRKCSRVGAAAAAALAWVSGGGGGGGAAPAGVKFATSRGSLLASRAFTAEQEDARATNDDRVLATALNLNANLSSEPDVDKEGGVGAGGVRCVRRVRAVVLLTDDRNLRVKALAAELPTRDLPSYCAWAGVSCQEGEAASGEAAEASAEAC